LETDSDWEPEASRQELFDEAILLLGVGADERAKAEAEIRELIEAYSGWRALEEETPRVADLRRMLEEMQDLARRLGTRIVRAEEAGHFDTLSKLLSYDFVLHPRLSDLAPKAGLTYGPQIDDDGLRLATMLEALARYCETGTGLLGRDRGGRTNVFKARYGNAVGILVRGAVGLFAEFRGAEALTATESGPCAAFCRAILDLADGTKEFDVTRHVKYAVPRLRERCALIRRMADNLIIQTNIPGYEPSPGPDELSRRISELDQELLKGPR